MGCCIDYIRQVEQEREAQAKAEPAWYAIQTGDRVEYAGRVRRVVGINHSAALIWLEGVEQAVGKYQFMETGRKVGTDK